jgi:hypothetical protein
LFSKDLIIKPSFFNQKDLLELFSHLQKLGKKVSFQLHYGKSFATVSTIEDLEQKLDSLEVPLNSINILVANNSFDSERIKIRLDCDYENGNRVELYSDDESFLIDNELRLTGILQKYEKGLIHRILCQKRLKEVMRLVLTWSVFMSISYYVLIPLFKPPSIGSPAFLLVASAISYWALSKSEWLFKQFLPYLDIETEKVHPKSVQIKKFLQTRFLDWVGGAVIGTIFTWLVQRFS